MQENETFAWSADPTLTSHIDSGHEFCVTFKRRELRMQ